MNLSPNFTLYEFTVSQNAARLGINNTPNAKELDNLRQTAHLMERIRSVLGKPITITSGYRSDLLNAYVGSNTTSDHVQGLAADFYCQQFGTPYAICKALSGKLDELGIGQLIYEFNAWVHVGITKPRNDNNRILTINRSGTKEGLLP